MSDAIDSFRNRVRVRVEDRTGNRVFWRGHTRVWNRTSGRVFDRASGRVNMRVWVLAYNRTLEEINL
jgi:hypothetical protein